MVGAGLVHARLAPEHFEEWWGYGVVFVAAAFAQVILGLGLLTDALRSPDAAPHLRRWDRTMVWAAVGCNVALVVVYVVSRTVGVPVGPERGEVEPVGLLDVVTKLLEAAAILLLGVALRRERAATTGRFAAH
jgi:hypothetical protein